MILVKITLIIWLVASTPTNPIEKNSIKSTLSGATSNFVQDQGHVLTKVEMYQTQGITNQHPGIKLTFTKCSSGAQQVLLYGSVSTVGVTVYQKAFTKQVSSIYLCAGSGDGLNDIGFNFVDGNSIRIKGNLVFSDCSESYSRTIQFSGNFVGLSFDNVSQLGNLASPDATHYVSSFSAWDDECFNLSLPTLQNLDDLVYIINDNTLTTTSYTTNISFKSNCFTLSATKTGISVPKPTWLIQNIVDRTFSISSNNAADIGIYAINLVAAFFDQTTCSQKKTQIVFNITIQSDCVKTILNSGKTINNMSNKVSFAEVVQDITFTDTIATSHGAPTYCGERTYTFFENLTFLKISGTTMSLSSDEPSKAGVYSVTLTISLKDYPLVAPIAKIFSATLICEVQNILVVKSPPTTSKYKILIDAPLILPFQFTETLECGLIYSCVPKIPFQSVPFDFYVDGLLRQITISSKSLKDAGTYTLQLIAEPANGTPMVVDFNVEMIDMCKTASFVQQRVPSIEIMRQSKEYQTIQYLNLQEFDYQLKLDCGKIIKTLYLTNTKVAAPSWMSINGNQIQLEFQSMNGAYNQVIDLYVFLQEYPDRSMTASFSITLSESEITCFQGNQQVYSIGEDPLSFGVQYLNRTSVVNSKLTSVQEPIAFNNDKKQIELPSFLKFDKKSKVFTISSASLEDIGTYNIGLKLGYLEYPDVQVKCTTSIQVKYVPKFIGDTIEPQTFSCKFPWSLKIPIYKDAFQKIVESYVNLGQTKDFLEYDEISRIIKTLDPELLVKYAGNYEIKLALTDQFGNQKEIVIKLVLLCLDQGQNSKKSNFDYNQIIFQEPPPKPYIKYINNVGNMRIAFTRPILLPTFNRFPEFIEQDFLRRNCTNGSICSEKRILKGDPTLENDLKQALEIVNRGFLRINNTLVSVVDLQMVPGSDSNQSALQFTWKCVDFKPKYLDFTLNFSFYGNVSIQDQKDSLKVIFYGNKYFGANDGQVLSNQNSKTVHFVPKQVNPSYAKELANAADSVGSTSKVILILNFCKNFLIGGALQEIFSAIKKISIMVHLLIVNVNIPANAQIYFNGLLSFVTFSLYDIEEPIRKGLNLYNEQVLNDNFYQLGYHSSYSVITFGNLFVVMIVYLFLFLMLGITSNCKNEKIIIARKWIAQKIVWDGTLSFISESYLLLAISCFSNFNYYQFRTAGEIFSGIFAQFGAIMLVSFPLFLLWFVLTNKTQIKDEQFREKFSTIYESLSKKDGKATLIEPFLSVTRVLILIAALIFLQKYRYFQIFCCNFLSLFMIIYVGWNRPYQNEVNFWQQYNEVFIVFMIYHLICFADLILDEPTRDIMGFSMIIVCSLNLFTNFFHIMFGEIKTIFKGLRLKYYKWKIQKLKKRIIEKEEIAKAKNIEEEKKKADITIFNQSQQSFKKEPKIHKQDNQLDLSKHSERQLLAQKDQSIFQELVEASELQNQGSIFRNSDSVFLNSASVDQSEVSQSIDLYALGEEQLSAIHEEIESFEEEKKQETPAFNWRNFAVTGPQPSIIYDQTFSNVYNQTYANEIPVQVQQKPIWIEAKMKSKKSETNVVESQSSLPAGQITAKLQSDSWQLKTNRGIKKQTASVQAWDEGENEVEEPFPNKDLELGKSPTYQQVITKPLNNDPDDTIARLRERVINRMKEARVKFSSPEQTRQKFTKLWRPQI